MQLTPKHFADRGYVRGALFAVRILCSHNPFPSVAHLKQCHQTPLCSCPINCSLLQPTVCNQVLPSVVSPLRATLYPCEATGHKMVTVHHPGPIV